jgi:hypothetical protein
LEASASAGVLYSLAAKSVRDDRELIAQNADIVVGIDILPSSGNR